MTLDNSMIIAGFAACGTAIAVMWTSLKAENARLSARSDKCEADRVKLFNALAKLTGDSELLENCPAEKCPFKTRPPHQPLLPVTPLVLLFCFLLTSCQQPDPASIDYAAHEQRIARYRQQLADGQLTPRNYLSLVRGERELEALKLHPGIQ